MKLRIFFLILLTLSAPGFALAQNDWEKTPYQNWTKDQVKKILNNSPWVKTKTFRQATTQTRFGDMVSPETTARMTLRSALPVRQALLRQRQLNAKYDKMTDDEKKAFDAKNSALLDCPACREYYAVEITSQYLTMDNKDYVSDRKKFVYLSNENGDRRELADFVVLSQQDNELVFFFPRRNEKGENLLTPKTKTLTFNFELKGLDGKSVFPFEKFDIDVSTLIVNGEVAF